MISIKVKIANIGIRIRCDSSFYELNKLSLFKINTNDSILNSKINIQNFSIDSDSSFELNEKEKKALINTVYFPFRWLSNPIFRYKPFRETAFSCVENPEMSHIALNWNRAIVRNYTKNEFSLFYPIDKQYELNSPLFIARLRNLVGNSFPKFNSVMIHGAGLIFGDKAAVFLAPDEGGKSTLIKKSKKRGILSDDHIVLKKDKERVTVHGTPFGELTDGPLSAELGGVFLLEKSEKFKIERIKPNEILQFVWNDQFVKWYQYPKLLRIRIFDIITHASKIVPIYRLKLPIGYIDWVKIEDILK